MQLRAWPARTGVSHHPEIVGLAPVENVNRWIEIGVLKEPHPMIVRFLIELARFVRPWFVNRRVKTLRRKIPTVHN